MSKNRLGKEVLPFPAVYLQRLHVKMMDSLCALCVFDIEGLKGAIKCFS